MNELIERLRSVKWEAVEDWDRMPDDPMQKCVFVDMRPDDFRALLEEAAAALEAAREDAERWRWLMAAAKEHNTRWSIFDTTTDQARGKGVAGRWKVGEVKPCEVPCPKCGHNDIHRVFRAKGSDWRCKVYGRAENKYASADTYIAKAWRDHIDNTCRCCRYRWQTLPLRKRRPTQQQETPR